MIVVWEIHECESVEYAAEMIYKASLKHGISHQDNLLVLHSDNGSPMKGATMLFTLQRLRIVPSFSRPRVSNDNPYSESLFRTLKYRPSYPSKPFQSLSEARKEVRLGLLDFCPYLVTLLYSDRFGHISKVAKCFG